MKTAFPSLVLLLPLLAGCPSSEATPPTTDDVGDGSDDATDTGSDDATDTGTDTATDTGTDTTGDECLGPDGCFACEPVQPTEFLDACTDATCEAFPNTPERLPLLERDGTLPPLP